MYLYQYHNHIHIHNLIHINIHRPNKKKQYNKKNPHSLTTIKNNTKVYNIIISILTFEHFQYQFKSNRSK